MKKFLNLMTIASLVLLLSSCSVAMAARKEGTDITTVQNCKTRGQLLSQGGKLLSSERMPNGELVEVYQFLKERGSASRAFMHGVLDVATCGVWEVLGTPIEGSDVKEYYSIKVRYDAHENVKQILLS